ncbi:MAG: hypothetical protein J6386_13825 [Candidatus Synoicihabitans palmerolidicus]|nr:hypothetical protein [Candidatus Synoicihabitans palmerolidicus]
MKRGGDGEATVAELEATMGRVGAFPWTRGTRDAALWLQLTAGIYTAAIGGNDDSSGVALVEAYDANSPAGSSLANLWVRAQVGSGNGLLVGGLTVGGEGSVRLLVRAVGPGLEAFGVLDTLVDPQLRVMRGLVELASNDDWDMLSVVGMQLVQAAELVGAFPLRTGSGDAAIVVELVAGGYTLQVSGADGGTGVALLEIYVLP